MSKTHSLKSGVFNLSSVELVDSLLDFVTLNDELLVTAPEQPPDLPDGSRPSAPRTPADEDEVDDVKAERRVYEDLVMSDPLVSRRNKALQAVYQFLEEEGLFWTVEQLEKESGLPFQREESAAKKQFGVLIEALDLRESFHQSLREVHPSQNTCNLEWLKQTVEAAPVSDRIPTVASLEVAKKAHTDIGTANLLCVDLFRRDSVPYLLVGAASRKVWLFDCTDTVLNVKHTVECANAIRKVADFTLSAPPLYASVDPLHKRFAAICTMDGNLFLVDLKSHIDSSSASSSSASSAKSVKLKPIGPVKAHGKYVVLAKWSADSQYLVSGSHDETVAVWTLDAAIGSVSLRQRIRVNGCVESLAFVPPNSGATDDQIAIGPHVFATFVRGGYELLYFDIDAISVHSDSAIDEVKVASDDETDAIKAIDSLNVNAFGDRHVSFSITDLCFLKSDMFVCKTDSEKALLFSGTQQLKTYFGAHSDPYSYTRVALSPNLKYIYASSRNDFVAWNTVTGKAVRKVKAHSHILRDLVVDPLTGAIVTVSFDKTLKIWTPP